MDIEEKANVKNVNLDIRVRICESSDIIYGSGISDLLIKTDELRSLNAAAKELGMPYKKALYVVSRAEKVFQHKILKRTVGGVGGGGSELTDFGKILVYKFREMEKDLERYGRQLMRQYLPNLSSFIKPNK